MLLVFKRKQPIRLRLPAGKPTVRTTPWPAAVAGGPARTHRGLVGLPRPPRAGSQATRPVRPLGPLVVSPEQPRRAIGSQQLGNAAMRWRQVVPPSPPFGTITRKF